NKGVIINGNVELIPCPTITTWDGTSWDNGTPTLALGAILNGNYDTGIQGNLTTCNLTVNAGVTLTISDNTYLEVDNDIIVDGTLNVASNGGVVQNSDTATVTENGTITVTKQTAPLNNWYEYTYWSSPVANETIGTALAQAQPTRRYSFNAQNFEDSFRETNNDNSQVPGQDDIDDNGDDWTFVNNATVMQPGVGYAATHAEALFIGPPMSSPPYQFDYVFEGPFNNGVITVPIYRNDAQIADINWNFIGNPYPSAVDVDLFINENVISNGLLDGAIYLWSQKTEPSETENGNEQLNFTQSDYALINGAGETAGGEGVVPNRYIPSGQGFFVSFSDALPSNTGNVVFNNSMRVTGNNAQFFRGSIEDTTEKIRVNLTSDNGVFNQILVSYVDGATDTFDGFYYDAPRNLSSGANSIIYSRIDNNDKKFAIQGRDPNSINDNEVIELGFYTSIDVSTIYTLSLAEYQGSFIASNAVLLKDNLLNTYHDLKQSDYNFTSTTGEFNDRFEIVFNESALSTDDLTITSAVLNITELNTGDVKFSITNNLTITKVEILDLLGRTVYQFKGDNSTEIYDLSAMSKSAYFAKVHLSNGQILTKKAIKQF
ncbi:MAG: T9SS type A sorting domain-containing protein, partial [Winogradskyella sp.]|nr:T9SS type A sorting domain-containing protein [Winogradskyella sp.]